MDNKVAICAQGLTKIYRLGRREIYGSLRDTVVEGFAGLFRFHRSNCPHSDQSAVSALTDVSFEIEAGEAVGVIGPNGAGKSTLLKILSRITEPTNGYAEVRGRVGCLLEVGTGFHPELTGRENIYLNGAILGMQRSEIERKFDGIVSFAEVERFLDTPVKRYSSGMYVRLAFAVAAYLEPEILLVDEVLSVGDAAFQKKCLSKMEEATGEGRTVLLVSHNMGAIKSLTRKALWLERGRLKRMGDSSTIVNEYLASVGNEWRNGFYALDYIDTHRVRHQKYVGTVRLLSVRLYDETEQTCSLYLEGSMLSFQIEFYITESVEVIDLFVRVRSLDGQLVFTAFPGKVQGKFLPGSYSASVSLELGPLLPGVYRGDVVLLTNLPQDNVSPAFEFEITPNPTKPQDFRTVLFGAESQADYSGIGLIRARSVWRMTPKLETGP